MSALTTSTDPGVFHARTGASRLLTSVVLRVLALVILFSGAAIVEVRHVSAVLAPEVWVHLRTGEWILHNRSIPRTGLFSQSSNLSWDDSTWVFDATLAAMYRVLGLRAIPILLMLLKVSLAAVSFLLARSIRASFWGAVALSAIAQYVISNLQPLPYVFSIFFVAIELWLLMRCRYSGETRKLFYLPLLFVLWANLHLQFLAGLLLLAAFLIAVVSEQALRNFGVSWLSPAVRPLDLKTVGTVAALSFLGSLANPYAFHLLPASFKVLYSPVGFEHFTEMSSMGFRRPQDYVLMLLVMMAFLALGRRRTLALFELLMLLAGTFVAFRVGRDGWLAVLPAIAVLSGGFGVPPEDQESRKKRFSPERMWASALTGAVILFTFFRVPNSSTLMSRVSQNYPVKACNYIMANHLPEPLFNSYSWGSFLTWYLPQYPVVVDSRVELYGDKILGEYFDVIGGKEKLEDHPMVSGAGTLLLERQSAMAKALVNLPALSSQYKQVYSDDMASVFVPQRTGQ